MEEYIEKALTLSTAHISERTAFWLDSPSAEGHVLHYSKQGFGWFIYAGAPEEHTEKIPFDLLTLLKFAHQYGCCWLQLDCDGLVHPDLNTYEW